MPFQIDGLFPYIHPIIRIEKHFFSGYKEISIVWDLYFLWGAHKFPLYWTSELVQMLGFYYDNLKEYDKDKVHSS